MAISVAPLHSLPNLREPTLLESVSDYWRQGLQNSHTLISRVVSAIFLLMGTLFLYGVLAHREEQLQQFKKKLEKNKSVAAAAIVLDQSNKLPRSPQAQAALAKDRLNTPTKPLFPTLTTPPASPRPKVDAAHGELTSQLAPSPSNKGKVHFADHLVLDAPMALSTVSSLVGPVTELTTGQATGPTIGQVTGTATGVATGSSGKKAPPPPPSRLSLDSVLSKMQLIKTKVLGEPKAPLQLPLEWQQFVVEPTDQQFYYGPAHFLGMRLWDEHAGMISCSGLPHNFNLMIGNVSLLQQQLSRVIVNAANCHLQGGHGIDGAIHAMGGASYEQAHRDLSIAYGATRLHPCYPNGAASLIGSGELIKKGYKGVIVVAGPAPGSREPTIVEINQLYQCYYNSLYLAAKNDIKSVAFPLISTAIFGFPKELAAKVSLRAISDFANFHPDSSVKNVLICAYDNAKPTSLEELSYYKNALQSP